MKNIFKVDGKFRIIPLLVSVAIPLIGSYLIKYITKDLMGIYTELKKPVFFPPDSTFGIVWPILYIIMGISTYRVYMKLKQGIQSNAIFFYIIQLLLNFLWPIIFFNLRLYAISFIELVILLIFIIITIIKFIKVDKISGVLLIPYALWVTYAGVLNFFIWVLNEM